MDRLIKTRATLIQRLKDWQDQVSWQEFFDLYGPLVFKVALRGGLNECEAQDVVQETMLSVAKHMPCFKYDPAIGSFKTWLLNQASWHIIDQYRRRGRIANHMSLPAESATTTTMGRSAVENLVDPTSQELSAHWEIEWERNLLEAAIRKIKRRLAPQNYQIFDLYANKGWTPARVAETFRVPAGQVYLIKHRVTEMIKEEVKRLETKAI